MRKVGGTLKPSGNPTNPTNPRGQA